MASAAAGTCCNLVLHDFGGSIAEGLACAMAIQAACNASDCAAGAAAVMVVVTGSGEDKRAFCALCIYMASQTISIDAGAV
jgi:hypothetical protein